MYAKSDISWNNGYNDMTVPAMILVKCLRNMEKPEVMKCLVQDV